MKQRDSTWPTGQSATVDTHRLDGVARTLLMLEVTEALIAELNHVPAGTVLELLRSCDELDLGADDFGRAALMAQVREKLVNGHGCR